MCVWERGGGDACVCGKGGGMHVCYSAKVPLKTSKPWALSCTYLAHHELESVFIIDNIIKPWAAV